MGEDTCGREPNLILVDAAAAAVSVRRPFTTVYGWGQSGAITRQGKDARGRWLYDLAEVQVVAARSPTRARSDAGHRRCTAQRRSGQLCDAPALDDLPFPLCAPHVQEMYEHVTRLITNTTEHTW